DRPAPVDAAQCRAAGLRAPGAGECRSAAFDRQQHSLCVAPRGGRSHAVDVDFDLSRTLQRIVEVMKIAALGKDLDVALVYDKHMPPIVRGNQARIRQVVTNLMENAVKFTEEGTVVLNVSQQTETDTHRVIRFEVRDTGPGIAAEDRLLLFERFSQ